MARGCAKGESGKPNANTQLAPKGAISQGMPDSTLSQPVMAIAVMAPNEDSRTNFIEGAGGAPELNSLGIDIDNPFKEGCNKDGFRVVYRSVSQSQPIGILFMATSKDIVAASLKLFYRQGFHATGVDLLSREADVTKKTLYRHYPSKDALIDAALTLRHTQFMSKMRAFVDAVATDLRPLAYIDYIASWVQEDDFYGCAFINAVAEFSCPDAPPHQQAAKHKQEIQAYLKDLCIACRISQPELISEQLFVLGEGMIVASQIQGYNVSRVSAARMMARNAWLSATGISAITLNP